MYFAPWDIMSTLYEVVDGYCESLLPLFEFTTLNHDAQEARFLVLHPCAGDKGAFEHHVSCSLEVQPIHEAEPFIAISNSRGYRKLEQLIELNGHALSIAVALERFLRYFRRSDEPVRLWIRHVCIRRDDPEEKRQYWTREFVDDIYLRASEVVDMSDYLADLREANIINKVVDPRYNEWEKIWDGFPRGHQQMLLPSVFPFRLGKKPSVEQPTDNFEYVPLDMVADEIRVLVIMESEDPLAPLVAHIAHCPILCEVFYHGLSYTWGSEQATVEMVLNGQKILIRRNLADALRSLRFSKEKVTVWADAICIDQQNIPERNRQLRRMAEIFNTAKGVVCYVGEPDEHSDMALDFVNDLQEPMMRFNDKGEWDVGREMKISPGRLPLLCAALFKFMTRPYFRRVWILQEVAVASNSVIACGNRRDVLFYKLEIAARNLQGMLRRDWGLANAMMQALPELKLVSQYELFFLRKMFYFRHLTSGGVHPHAMPWKPVNFGKSSPGYLETAIMARDFEATDPRDKIYALWNLAKDKDNLHLQMDYSKTVKESFSTFAVAWSEQHGSLDIVGAVELACGDISNDRDLPSWCPDWSTPSGVSCLVRRERIPDLNMVFIQDLDGALYAADGSMKQQASNNSFFEFDGDVLCCTGIILDRIDVLFMESPIPPSESQTGFSALVKYECWAQWIRQFYVKKRLATYDDPEQAIVAMLHGDVVSAWPHRSANIENVDEDFASETYVCLPGKSRHIDHYANTYCRTHAEDVVGMVSRGRVPFISKDGFMGLAPYTIQTDDPAEKPWLLAILATCSVPVLLQELDDGTYKVCGTCFVQGWMEGEMLTAHMDIDAAGEFWTAIEGMERLKLV